MKKLSVILALILCLVLSAFAFASCGKDKADATTASKTAAPTAAATTAPSTTTAHVHVPGDEKVVDVRPTCTVDGSKSFHCTVCSEIIPESIEAIPAPGHTPEEDFTTVAATCKDTGMKYKVCEVCGNTIDSTIEILPIDPNAHEVAEAEWTVTSAVDLFHDTGSREGVCTICGDTVVEEIKFKPTVKEGTAMGSSTYRSAQFNILKLQGDAHFYPTDADPLGNDLLIEFSILWNPTMLNLAGTSDPYCATRVEKSGTGTTNLTYWSGTDNPSGSWCPYAGGFEGSSLTGGSPAGMMKDHGDYADYPNIGGSVAPADAENLDNGHEWGWHRFGMRIHEEVTNLSALLADDEPGKTAATYKTTVTVYFDGVEIYSVYGDFKSDKLWSRLYSVSSNGDGTVTYADIDESVVAIPFAINSTTTVSGTIAYIVIADQSATCGKAFVQNVQRVDNPTAATYEVAEGVAVPAAMYFQLKAD